MALRGLIGSSIDPRDRFDDEREDLRNKVLAAGMEQETLVKIGQMKMGLFGSLAHGDQGKILAGYLTETRFNAFWDLMQAMLPYEDFSKSRSGSEAEQPMISESEKDAERKKSIAEYEEMVKKGII